MFTHFTLCPSQENSSKIEDLRFNSTHPPSLSLASLVFYLINTVAHLIVYRWTGFWTMGRQTRISGIKNINTIESGNRLGDCVIYLLKMVKDFKVMAQNVI